METNLFIPGRLCVLGEHTDWGGGYASDDGLEGQTGRVIVAALNEGLYATVTANADTNSSSLVSSTPHVLTYSTISCNEKFSCDMNDVDTLEKFAKDGNFFSYVAGTCLECVRYCQTNAIPLMSMTIANYKTTLPMKRGLSSSAAVCVLIVHAFKETFNLKLSTMQVMDLAYLGETRTPSRCGRMDQCVAMGKDKIALMTFKGNFVSLEELHNDNDLFFVVANLNAGKNTVAILKALNEAFDESVVKTSDHTKFHRYMKDSYEFVGQAVSAINSGRVKDLGKIMNLHQNCFDENCMPLCPDQLTSPKLHRVMTDAELKQYTFAIKGVGSQGDGSVQVLCKDKICQESCMTRLEQLDCTPFRLTVPKSNRT